MTTRDNIWSPARFLCVLVLGLTACDTAIEFPGTVHTDSAGIAIATAVEPLWGPGEGWTVSAEPRVQIGAATGANEYLLDNVVGAVRLSNGDIVLGEWMSGELRRYDRNGTFMWRAAGRGEGPGEHALLRYVGALAGDSVVTWDSGLRRVQVFAPDGAVVRTLRVDAPWSGFLPRLAFGVSGRDLLITLADERGGTPDGVVRWPGLRIATVSLDDAAVTTVMDVPGDEQVIARQGRLSIAYTFGKGPKFAVTGDRLALVDTEVFSIRSISLADATTAAILRRDEPIREVTSADVDAYIEWMIARNMYGGRTREDVEPFIPAWREDPMASTLPVLQSIHLDPAGNLWVEPHSPPGAEVPPLEVHTADGDWLGSVAMPPGLDLDSEGLGTPFEIGEDYILGLWRDAQNVEYVRVYGLEK